MGSDKTRSPKGAPDRGRAAIWFGWGRSEGAAEMVVVFDDFDGTFYPEYLKPGQTLGELQDMQYPQVTFDLTRDFSEQFRSFYGPRDPGEPHPMRALSIRPPCAWAIAHSDKRIENRSWSTPYRGPLVIHASQKFTAAETAELEKILGNTVDPSVFARSAFVAIAELVIVDKAETVVPNAQARWLSGPYAWLLENVRTFTVPIPARGRLGLWRPTDDQRTAIERATGSSSSDR